MEHPSFFTFCAILLSFQNIMRARCDCVNILQLLYYYLFCSRYHKDIYIFLLRRRTVVSTSDNSQKIYEQTNSYKYVASISDLRIMKNLPDEVVVSLPIKFRSEGTYSGHTFIYVIDLVRSLILHVFNFLWLEESNCNRN